MNIPLNGRIAIIDDQIEQALPLIKVFSKNQIPYVFYKGSDLNYLPEEDERFNDIRIVFLDINLIDNAIHPDKDIKSVLIGVLRRVISKENYPYLLIYWSRTQDEQSNIINEIFENELADRKPISKLPFVKSAFFPNLGSNEQANEIDIIVELDKVLLQTPAYRYLLKWENLVHISADKTLQEIFNNNKSSPDWLNRANFLFNKLGISYAGFETFFGQEPLMRVKSSLSAFNNVFYDSLEYGVNSCLIENVTELTTTIDQNDSIFSINSKLLFSKEISPLNYSGAVLEWLGDESNDQYEKLLHVKTLKSQGKKDEIRKTWKKIWFCVTPLCDFVQGKLEFNRIINGLIVGSEFSKCFYENQNEAVYTSPCFQYEENNYCLILDFRHLFALEIITAQPNLNPLFRAKQQLLAEVQSRLARHISRQGVLFLDKR